MTLSPGTRLGPYQIVAPLGAGGMGEVYRARDPRLGREVAIKVLPPEVANDPERLRRFEQEARAASALNHPNILTVHDVGAEGGTSYLVTELLEGQSLRELLREGALAPKRAVDLAIQIAKGLAAAHAKGIAHRDLKPENLFLTENGAMKILDFGLARFEPRPTSGSELAKAPTVEVLTGEGTVLGTVGYMSPEQVRGEPADPRSDLFSLGCVLLEMLSGKRAFAGESAVDTMHAILRSEPAGLDALEPDLTPSLVRVLCHGLEKRREARFQSARDFRFALEDVEIASTGSRSGLPIPRARASWHRPALLILGALALVAIVVWQFREALFAPPRLELASVRRLTSMPGNEDQPTWSPDGEMIAFVSEVSGNRDLWIKRLSGGDAIQVTHDPADEFDPDWSPDGASLAFRSNRKNGGLFTMPALGGESTRISDFGYKPRWSPDGRRLLFQLRRGNRIPNEIYLTDVPPSGEPHKLLAWREGGDPYLHAVWSPDGRSFICSSGAYTGRPGFYWVPMAGGRTPHFLEFAGQRIAGGFPAWTRAGLGLVFQNGPLVYVPLDQQGWPRSLPTVLTTGQDEAPAISMATGKLAYDSLTRQSDIWKVHFARATGRLDAIPIRIISGPANEISPATLPDGQHFLFLSDQDSSGQTFLYLSDFEGRGVRLLDHSRNWDGISDISRDGRWIVLTTRNPFSSWALPFDPTSFEVLGPPRLLGAQILATNLSPDDRYLLVADAGSRSPSGLTVLEHPFAGNGGERVVWPLDASFNEQFPNRTYSYFSPNGNWIVFGAYKERSKPSIFVVHRDSTSPRLLWTGSGFPSWLADPNRIYLTSEREDETSEKFGFLPFDAEGKEDATGFTILDLRPAPGELDPYAYTMTPDAEWIIFSAAQVEGDIYVADLVER